MKYLNNILQQFDRWIASSIVLRKSLPFIPIIGIPLTFRYHMIHGDTGIENLYISVLTAVIQGCIIGDIFYKITLYF